MTFGQFYDTKARRRSVPFWVRRYGNGETNQKILIASTGPLFFILGPLRKSRKNKVLFVENLIFNLKNKIQNFQFLQVFFIFNKNYISIVQLPTAVAL